jgi:hypothetical protein
VHAAARVSWAADTLALYARVFQRAAVLTVRNPTLVLAVVAYVAVLALTLALTVALLAAGPLAILAGFVWTVALAACFGSWLALTERVVTDGRTTTADLLASFRPYLVDVLVVGFLIGLLRMLAALVLAPFPFLQIVFGLATVVFFNAAPELIYLGRHTPVDLLAASYTFIAQNWIEWFPPSIALFMLIAAVAQLTPAGPHGLVLAAVVGLVASYAWVVRGLLFVELTTSSRRTRDFQRRAAR